MSPIITTLTVYVENSGNFSGAATGKRYYTSELLKFVREGGTVFNAENNEKLDAETIKELSELWRHCSKSTW